MASKPVGHGNILWALYVPGESQIFMFMFSHLIGDDAQLGMYSLAG
jgi:hypothetical protein